MTDLTPQTFAASLLKRLGIHQTPGAIQALVGWERAEGGNWNNDAKYNPLNTTQPAAGAGNTGSQGNIKVYRNWDQGLQATVDTLKNGRYGGILHALSTGDPGAVASAIGRSPWGTSGGLVSRTIGSTPRVAGVHAVAGSGGGSAAGSGGSLQGALTSTPGSGTGFNPGTPQDPGSLAGLLQQPQAPPVPFPVAPTPAFQSPVIQPAQPPTGLADALAQVASTVPQGLPDVTAGSSTAQVSGKAPTASAASTGGGKTASFDGKTVVAWMVPALQYARQHGWKGQVVSGVRSHALQTQLYNDYKAGRRAGPVAVPGQSNHEIQNGGAVDVSDPNDLARIMQGYQGRRLKQGTAIGDPVHFSASGR